MEAELTIKRTSNRSAEVTEPIVIEENGDHRKVFWADLNSVKTETGETVGGTIVHQRKKSADKWEDIASSSFAKLHGGECAKMHLKSSTLKRLYDYLSCLYQVSIGDFDREAELTLARADEIVKVPKNVRVLIEQMIKADHGEQVWEELSKIDPNLAKRLALGEIQVQRAKALDEFRWNLDEDVLEGTWADFLEANSWIFGYGLDYRFLRILQREAYVGQSYADGSGQGRADFLLFDSQFTVLVELKRASTQIFGRRLNRANAWCLSNELVDAVSQVQAQKADWLQCGEEGKLFTKSGARVEYFTFDPKCILVIGNKQEFLGDDRENLVKARTFELFRRGLRDIEVLTFDELFDRASFLVAQEQIKLQPEDVMYDGELPF